ncbi:MAG: lipopolysaccharide biosynthesis protein [Planctomycetota bacterium]
MVDHDRLLRTDHLQADLRRRSVRGGAVLVVEQALQFAIQMVAVAVLARLLVPADFGLVAMVVAMTTLVGMLRDLGLSTATVQRADLTHAQVSVLFWLNVGLGVLASLVVAGLAPAVAAFYGDARLTAVTWALAGSFLLASLSAQHLALLRRQMRFASLARIELAAALVGAAAAVGAAWRGAGYWALVTQPLVAQVVLGALVWWSSGWRPQRPKRGAGSGAMLAFGGHLTGFRLATYVAQNLDDVLIGRTAGSAALGLYSKAYSLLMMPVHRISGPVSAVAIPALSRLQHEPRRFREFYLQATLLICAAGMPLVTLLFVMAEEAVLLVLGPQWGGAVPLFRALAPAALFATFNASGSWACVPLGRVRRLFWWQVAASTVVAIALVVGVRWGALGVAAAYSVAVVLTRFPGLAVLLRGTPVSVGDVAAVVTRPAVVSVLAGVGLAGARWLLPTAPGYGAGLAFALGIGVAAFAGLYAGLWGATRAGRQQVRRVVQMFRDLRVPAA